MPSMLPYYVVALIGLILTLAGFFGPEDEGTLEFIGLAILAVAVYKLLGLDWFA